MVFSLPFYIFCSSFLFALRSLLPLSVRFYLIRCTSIYKWPLGFFNKVIRVAVHGNADPFNDGENAKTAVEAKVGGKFREPFVPAGDAEDPASILSAHFTACIDPGNFHKIGIEFPGTGKRTLQGGM